MKRNTSAAKAIVCTVVLWTIPLLLAAQRSVPKLEDLPRRAIDTLDTDDSNIKIYGHTIQMYIVERGRNKDKRQ